MAPPPAARPVERLRAQARTGSDGGFGGWDAEDDEPPAMSGVTSTAGSLFQSANSSAAPSEQGGSQSGYDSPSEGGFEKKPPVKPEKNWDAKDDDWGDDDDWGK